MTIANSTQTQSSNQTPSNTANTTQAAPIRSSVRLDQLTRTFLQQIGGLFSQHTAPLERRNLELSRQLAGAANVMRQITTLISSLSSPTSNQLVPFQTSTANSSSSSNQLAVSQGNFTNTQSLALQVEQNTRAFVQNIVQLVSQDIREDLQRKNAIIRELTDRNNELSLNAATQFSLVEQVRAILLPSPNGSSPNQATSTSSSSSSNHQSLPSNVLNSTSVSSANSPPSTPAQSLPNSSPSNSQTAPVLSPSSSALSQAASTSSSSSSNHQSLPANALNSSSTSSANGAPSSPSQSSSDSERNQQIEDLRLRFRISAHSGGTPSSSSSQERSSAFSPLPARGKRKQSTTNRIEEESSSTPEEENSSPPLQRKKTKTSLSTPQTMDNQIPKTKKSSVTVTSSSSSSHFSSNLSSSSSSSSSALAEESDSDRTDDEIDTEIQSSSSQQCSKTAKSTPSQSRLPPFYPGEMNLKVAKVLLTDNYLRVKGPNHQKYKVTKVDIYNTGSGETISVDLDGHLETITNCPITDCRPSGLLIDRESNGLNADTEAQSLPFAVREDPQLKGWFMILKEPTKTTKRGSCVRATTVSIKANHGQLTSLEVEMNAPTLSFYPGFHGALGLMLVPQKTQEEVIALLNKALTEASMPLEIQRKQVWRQQSGDLVEVDLIRLG